MIKVRRSGFNEQKSINGFIGCIYIIYIVDNRIMDKFDGSAVIRYRRLDTDF